MIRKPEARGGLRLPSDSAQWEPMLGGMCQSDARDVAAVLATLRSGPLAVSPISDRGASPAFRVDGAGGQTWKLRICRVAGERRRTLSFVAGVQAAGWDHVARIVAVSGDVVLKTWQPGEPITGVTPARRARAIAAIGEALARLHMIAVDPGAGPGLARDPAEPFPPAYLVCAADDFNVVVDMDDRIAFVDLEACTWGPRWVDLVWAEELLCRDEPEQAALWRAYVCAGGQPVRDGCTWTAASRRYLEWLETQLTAATRTRPDHRGVREDLEAVRRRLAPSPTPWGRDVHTVPNRK